MTKFFLWVSVVAFILSGCSSEKVEPPPAPQQQVSEAETRVVEGGGREPSAFQEAAQTSVSSPAPSSEIKNHPPEVVRIDLSPKLVYAGMRIVSQVEGKDDDGDTVSYYYEWKRNDKVIEGEGLGELDTKEFKKGDLITLYVTPFDEKVKGKTAWSTTVMIANHPPEITSTPPGGLSDGRYLYEVKATDAEGDKLTYSLEGAPPGMAIDPASGVVQWNVPQGDKAKPGSIYNIKVVVSDGDAKAFQGFKLSLTK